MKRDIVISELALSDFDSAFHWYEQQRPGLGPVFKIEAESVFARIATSAEMFEVVHKGKRRALMKRFPYAIYFRLQDDKAVVLAITHTSRRDSTWKTRD